MPRVVLEHDLDLAGRAVYGPRLAVNPNDLVCLRDLPSFTSGLTQDPTTKIVRGDYITGKAGGQVWTGGTAPGDPLAIVSSSNVVPGKTTLTQSQLVVNLVPAGLTAATGSTLDAFQVPGATVAIGGGTTIATVGGFNWVTFSPPVLNGGLQIAHSATVTITGPPTGTATLNDATSLWVQTGTTRLAGTTIIQSLTGLLKATSGTVSASVGGTDYEFPLTFSQGVSRNVNAITGDYITGKSGDQFWIGSTTNGGNLSIYTGNGTLGDLTLRGNNVIITDNIHAALRINNSTSGLMAIRGLSGSALALGANDTNFFTINLSGSLTASNLGGATSVVVKVDPSGTFGRAVAGTDFENLLTFTQGVTRLVNAITGDYITGKAGGQYWTSGTSASDPLTIQTFATSPTGTLTLKAGLVTVPGTAGAASLTVSSGALRVAKTAASFPTVFGDLVGATATGFSQQVEIGSTTGNAGLRVGQDSTHSLGFNWIYNATAGSASAELNTYGYTNPISIDGSAVRVQTISGGAFVIGSLTGLLKGTSGTVGVGASGTDYQAPLSAANTTISFPTATTIKVNLLPSKFIAQGTADAMLSAAQFLGALGTGLVKNTTATGVLSIAVGGAGGDYEVPITFSTGLNRAGNTVTANLSTGVTGGQAAVGGINASESLSLRSTSHATKGSIYLGTSTYDETANALNLLSANTTVATPTLTLSSSSSVGQAVMHFRTNTAVMRAGLRADANNALYVFNAGGTMAFLTGGDAGTGSVRAKLFNNGNFQIAGGLSAGTDPADAGGLFSLTGTGTTTTGLLTSWGASTATIPTASFLIVTAHNWLQSTIQLSLANNVTSNGGINYVGINGPVIANSSTMAVTNAATLAIFGPPTASGGVTLTNPYSFRVQAGVSGMNDGLQLGIPSGSSNLMLSLMGKTGFDSVLLRPQGGTTTTGTSLIYFWVNPQGSSVSDGVVTSRWAGMVLTAPSFSRAGVGTAPSCTEATNLVVAGEPTFSGAFTVGSRYAMHLSGGVARFDAGSAVGGDGTIVFEVPAVAPLSAPSTVWTIPVRVTGQPGLFYIPLQSNS